MEKMSEKERIVSRLREFMSLADTAPVVKFAEQYFPIAIVLIKNEADFASRFISQQHREVNFYFINIIMVGLVMFRTFSIPDAIKGIWDHPAF
jgi:hypothetical protein